VSLTNVHAMVHKSTAAGHQTVPMIELCLHSGGGEKYGRSLTVADDSLSAVQRLKLVLSECFDDCEGGFDEERLADTDIDGLK